MISLDAIAISIEDILGNGPMKEPKDYPTVGYSNGYRGNDPDAPDDAVMQEAFNEGHTRGWWEACQMLEPVLAALRARTARGSPREAMRPRSGLSPKGKSRAEGLAQTTPES